MTLTHSVGKFLLAGLLMGLLCFAQPAPDGASVPPKLAWGRLYPAIASSRAELRAAAILALVERRQHVPCQTEATLLATAFEAAQRSERRVPLRLRDGSRPEEAQKLLLWLDELPLDGLTLQRQAITLSIDRGLFPLAAELVERLDLSVEAGSKCSSVVVPDPLTPFEIVGGLVDIARRQGHPELLEAVHAALTRCSASPNPAGLAKLVNAVLPEWRPSAIAALTMALQDSPVENISPREFQFLVSELTRFGQQFAGEKPSRETLWTAAHGWLDRYFRSAACRALPEFERAALDRLAAAWSAPSIVVAPLKTEQVPRGEASPAWKSDAAFTSKGSEFFRLWMDGRQMIGPDSQRTKEWRASYERLKKEIHEQRSSDGEFGALAKSDGLFGVLVLSPRTELTQNTSIYLQHLASHVERPGNGVLLVGQALSHVRLLKSQNRDAFAAVVAEAGRLNSAWLSVVLWLGAPESYGEPVGAAVNVCTGV